MAAVMSTMAIEWLKNINKTLGQTFKARPLYAPHCILHSKLREGEYCIMAIKDELKFCLKLLSGDSISSSSG